ncbi:MAG: molybdopterin molybdotransferase MoeA [Elusimicrobia bacterium]|nr:molybdopterin molybdotransferase MoeA [Elusimicrobiota bacterium]
MIRYGEALGLLLEAGARVRLGAEEIPVDGACGRVAAEAARAPGPLPRFDNSAMDGYAVAASRTAGACGRRPLRLPVAGRIAAGDAPIGSPRPGFAWEIMTGAPMPAGCDAVARVEDVEPVDGGNGVLLKAPVASGDFVRSRGADLEARAELLPAGSRIGAAQVMILAAAGLGTVRARRRPRVAVIATGRELVAPGREAGPGRVHDGSSAFLAAALGGLGAELVRRERVADEPAAFAAAFASALAQEPELVVTTGAVSKGRFDFVAGTLAEAGCRTVFHGVAIRPGKPLLAAQLRDGPLVLGLPGNPVSTIVGLRFFGAPLLRAWLGLPAERPLRAPLARAVEKPAGLRCFFQARLEAEAGRLSARVLAGQASFQVLPLAEANAWVALPEPGEALPARTDVDAFPWLPQDPPLPSAARLPRRSARCRP